MYTIKVSLHNEILQARMLAATIPRIKAGPRVYRTFVKTGHGSFHLTTTSKDVQLEISTWMPNMRGDFCELLFSSKEDEIVIEFEGDVRWHVVRGSGHEENIYQISPCR